MQYLFDGIIIIALAMFTVIGVRKGIIKAAADLLGGIVSMIAAAMTAAPIAQFIYEKLFAQGVNSKVTEALEFKELDIAQYFSELPEFVTRWLETTGITAESLDAQVASSKLSAAQVVTEALSPVFIGLIKVFVVIILFLLFMIIIKGLAGLITGLFNLPLLKEVNGILGGILGFLFGVLVVWIAVAAISFFEPMMEVETQEKLSTMVESSAICRTVVEMNPVEWIFE